MKQDNVVKAKSTDFAVRIVKLVKYLVKQIPFAEHPICSQLLKSGTSIGANVREAEHAESTEDFIHKLKISLKESSIVLLLFSTISLLKLASPLVILLI